MNCMVSSNGFKSLVIGSHAGTARCVPRFIRDKPSGDEAKASVTVTGSGLVVRVER